MDATENQKEEKYSGFSSLTLCNILLLPLIGQLNLETKGQGSLGKKCSFLYYKAEQEKAEEESESNEAAESTFYIVLWKWKWRVGELH